MAAGIPLDDETRRPWLGRLHALLVEHEDSGAVLACSALKGSYRVILADDLPDVRFVALVAPPKYWPRGSGRATATTPGRTCSPPSSRPSSSAPTW